ncbi:MAG: nucleotide sugar dehydrogenase [Firmicutes bacterium]|nr:nucleotide sugar dehydrogenase [Bacillota bacterium]
MAVEIKEQSAVRGVKLNGTASALKAKILDKTARVAVVGAGYVGLPLAVEKAKVGFPVIAIDQNEKRVDRLNRGENYILDVKDEELAHAVEEGKLKATSDFSALPEADVIVICVPTPLTVNREPELKYIVNVTEQIAKYLRAGQLVCLESTTYPGTTEEVILPRLEATGLRAGQDFFLAFSPERVDPGNARYTTKNTNKLVGGVTPACLDVAATFYSQTILKVIPVSSPSVAEMAKVFENTYRAVNIALVNEMALLCDRMGLDVWEVLDAAFTKPFGIQPFYPGPGVGGHCIPIDPFYLTWKAREYDFSTRFIELAGEINLRMPYFVVEKTARILGQQRKSLRGAKVLVLGVAYKKDLPDERESPALKVIQLLLREGAEVSYHDPFIPEVTVTVGQNGRNGYEAHVRHEGQIGQNVGQTNVSAREVTLSSVALDDAVVEDADIVVITTDHSDMDYQRVAVLARAVLDTRNAMRGVMVESGKVWKL